jgi:hypothetical protein
MKEAQTKAAEPARQSPAAVRSAVAQHQTLGNLVDSSARVATQRKAVHTAFGALGAVAQRAPDIDDEPLQKKPAPANNTGLPDNLKSGVEQLSGMSLDHVKVHYNSAQPAQMQALAYAQGSHIHLAPGQEQHLPHEAWHVVQQAQGRVKPTFQMRRGVEVNDDSGLEHEADVMGAKALGLPALGAAEGSAQRKALHASSSGAVQLVPKADVYRGGAELEYRQGRAEVRFQNLPVVEGTSEDAIKGLIRSGMKGIRSSFLAGPRAPP